MDSQIYRRHKCGALPDTDEIQHREGHQMKTTTPRSRWANEQRCMIFRVKLSPSLNPCQAICSLLRINASQNKIGPIDSKVVCKCTRHSSPIRKFTTDVIVQYCCPYKRQFCSFTIS